MEARWDSQHSPPLQASRGKRDGTGLEIKKSLSHIKKDSAAQGAAFGGVDGVCWLLRFMRTALSFQAQKQAVCSGVSFCCKIYAQSQSGQVERMRKGRESSILEVGSGLWSMVNRSSAG